ncbi:glutathione-dependent disulfide-bond oxidoreductase [Alteromonas aestuariivivens]|uniref:Glutathione-dependent disulfide-bond oxidoreductase n=1 Tax=Alteromonas aestuariivivens TaxID=1938339 RepID=A0A3D8MA05_9ALTE|nr:glutathione-dependent disulfide-bond oxidoreductase [Alteromonas aestuariivivens]RDV26694.1 glutathione-dependent disulfide-bond oxidoreductase [Alteromonas aestuariivivens]
MPQEEYTPPKIWQWQQDGSRWSKTNRPVAGPTHEHALPIGKHPIQLYSLATPNGQKAAIMLEELLAMGFEGAQYDAHLIRIGEGDQFSSGFVDVNPNSKIPALMDHSVAPAQRVFESGSILLYLAEKFGALIPQAPAHRAECLSWLFWQVGSAPFLGGGFGHFYSYAPYKMEYPINRYAMETKRQLDVLDKHLSARSYLAGDEYSIADIATWTWYGGMVLGKLYDAAQFLQVQEYGHVLRWATEIAARPAVKRGIIVNKTSGDGPKLEERHSAADIDDALKAYVG